MSQITWSELLEQAASTGQGFSPIPSDDYDAKVERADARRSSNQKQYYAVMFRVTSGPYAKRTVWTNITLSPENPNALSIFFRHMDALGLTGDFFRQEPQPEQVAQALVGRTAKITVGQGEWKGKPRNTVTDIKPPSGAVAQAPQIGQAGAPPVPQVPTQPPTQAPAAPTAPTPPVPQPPTPTAPTAPATAPLAPTAPAAPASPQPQAPAAPTAPATPPNGPPQQQQQADQPEWMMEELPF